VERLNHLSFRRILLNHAALACPSGRTKSQPPPGDLLIVPAVQALDIDKHHGVVMICEASRYVKLKSSFFMGSVISFTGGAIHCT